MSADSIAVAPPGPKKLARGKKRSDAAPGHASKNTTSPEGAKEGAWPVVPLADLAADERNSITDGPFGSKLKIEHYTAAGPRVIRLKNIGDAEFVDAKSHISEAHFSSLQKHRVFPEDIVIAALGENPPRSCLVPEFLGPAIVKADCIRFKAGPRVLPKFLNYVLNAPDLRRHAKGIIHGVGRPRLNLGEIKALPIPVPPLDEQEQIVSEIEKQFTRLEAGVAALRRSQANLKRYRAAVLKAACEGRLTADGREQHTADGNSSAEGLPDGWECAPFSKFIESSFYGPRFGKESYAAEGVPTIRTTDIGFDGSVILADAPRIKLSADELDKYRLLHGDIVVTRTGATIGKCAVYDESRGPAIPSAYLIRFRLKKDLLDPKYILRFLMSPAGQSLLVGGSTAVAQPNVNAATIATFTIPVPPLAEQKRIVAEVERRLSVVDELDAVVSANLQRSNRLRQSILEHAFDHKAKEPYKCRS